MRWNLKITFDQPEELVIMHSLDNGFGVDTLSTIAKWALNLEAVLLEQRFELWVHLFEILPLTLSHHPQIEVKGVSNVLKLVLFLSELFERFTIYFVNGLPLRQPALVPMKVASLEFIDGRCGGIPSIHNHIFFLQTLFFGVELVLDVSGIVASESWTKLSHSWACTSYLSIS